MADSTEELQRKLADLNEQIAQLGGDAADIPSEIGGKSDGALDSEEIAATLNNEQENDAILALLMSRREAIVDQLGTAG